MLEPVISREIRLVSDVGPRARPRLEIVSIELPALRVGQILVRNFYMSVDAYMRGRLSKGGLLPPFRPGEPLEGAAVGQIVASTASGFASGDVVTSMCGWREYFVANPSAVRRVDGRIKPMSAHLGVLGSTGLTAWAGLQLAQLRAHDRVFVSAAGGAVGNVMGQLAKLNGCYVAGAANSDEAAATLVNELGFDAAFNGSQVDLSQELAAAFSNGIDVYLDNVGGTHLELVLAAMRPRGRIVTSGDLSVFDRPALLKSAATRALFTSKRLTMKGFLVSDWLSLAPVFQKTVGNHLLAGRLRAIETVIEGIARAPKAFGLLSRDDNMDKVIVKLA